MLNVHYSKIFICYFILLTTAHAVSENYEFDGLKFSCVEFSEDVMKCNDGKRDLVVIHDNDKYILFNQLSPLRINRPSKVMKNGQLFSHQEKFNLVTDTLEFQKFYAELFLSKTINFKDSFFVKVNNEASSYLKKIPAYMENVKVVFNNNEMINCSRGETNNLKPIITPNKELNDLRKQCTYYSCIGKDPQEKIIFYMPPIGSTYLGASLIAMKNGQARYYDDNFTISDSSNTLISKVNKSNYGGHEYYPSGFLQEFSVNEESLIPTKYNASKTAYNYFQSFAHGAQDTFGTRSICKGNDLNNLFNEQKKIANEMKDYLAYADIVSYVTAVNGNVRSAYVDRQKAQKLGCSFQDKIIDLSALPELQRMESLSGGSTQKKYPTEKEVQNLFKKAIEMKDIPYEYKEDGCFARAHIIARRFEKMGIPVKKAWLKGSLSVPGTNLNWRYHVAPMIEAKDSKGNIVQYIIDPTLADKAVPLDEWIASMDKNVSGPLMKTTYPIPENGKSFQRTVLAISSSDAYIDKDIKFITEEEKMGDALRIMAENKEKLKFL